MRSRLRWCRGPGKWWRWVRRWLRGQWRKLSDPPVFKLADWIFTAHSAAALRELRVQDFLGAPSLIQTLKRGDALRTAAEGAEKITANCRDTSSRHGGQISSGTATLTSLTIHF